MKFLLTILIILHISISDNFAKSYFISATDGDDKFTGLAPIPQSNNTGPFLTLARAIRIAQPGDTVFVRSGVYHENMKFKKSGSAKAPIVLQNYPYEYPTITSGSNAHTPVMEMSHVAYIQVAGLNFMDSNASCKPLLVKNSRHCLISKCSFSNNKSFAAIHLSEQSSFNEISQCFFKDNGTGRREWDTHIYLDRCGSNNHIRNNKFTQSSHSLNLTERGVWCSRTSDTKISGNTFRFLTKIALSIGIEKNEPKESVPGGNVIENNDFTQNTGICCLIRYASNTMVTGCRFFHNNAHYTLTIQGDVAKDNVIEKNQFRENGSIDKEYSDHISLWSCGAGNIIRDNDIFGTPDSSSLKIIKGYTAINVQKTSSVLIENNHIYNLNYPATIDKRDYNPVWIKTAEQGGRAGHGIWLDGVDIEVTDAVIRNNRIHHLGASAISVSRAVQSLIQGNECSFNGAWGISVNGRHNIIEQNTTFKNGWMHGGCSGINVHGRSRGNIVRKNASFYNRQGRAGEVGCDWWDDGNGIIADQGADSTWIYNNICYGNEGAGVAITASSDCFILNNTIVQNGYCEFAGFKAGLAVISTPEANRFSRRETIIGNILSDNAFCQLAIAETADHSHIMHHNLYFRGRRSTSKILVHYRDEQISWQERDFNNIKDFQQYWREKGDKLNTSGSLDVNPKFVCGSESPESPADLVPRLTSPVRMASLVLCQWLQDDFFSMVRSCEEKWDMGALMVKDDNRRQK